MRNSENWKLKIVNWEFIKGFTLIELIMVMALIGIMARIFIVTFPASQRRARDTQRKSNLKQFQTALEVFANNYNGFYPVQASQVRADTTLCTTAPPGGLGFAAGGCQADPKDGTTVCSGGSTCRYYYRSNAAGAQYVLWGALEQPKAPASAFFVVCSNGKSGEGTAPSSSACPI